MRRRYCAASDDARARLDAETLQIRLEGLRVGCSAGLEIQKLDLERLSARQLQNAAVALAAGLAQERVARRRRLRSLPDPSETAPKGPRRRPRRALFRGTARAARARPGPGLPFASMSEFSKYESSRFVEPEHDVLVRPLEVEGEPIASRMRGS
jgi:hypothetical protein